MSSVRINDTLGDGYFQDIFRVGTPGFDLTRPTRELVPVGGDLTQQAAGVDDPGTLPPALDLPAPLQVGGTAPAAVAAQP